MNCNENEKEALINDYVDGLLPDADRRALEEHLSGCAACRRAVQETRSILDEAVNLPRDIPPRRDLWPGIKRELTVEKTAGFRWQLPALAAAAALVLISGTAIATWMLARQAQPGPAEQMIAPVSTASLPSSAAGLLEAERDFNEATLRLLEVLRSERAHVRPGTVQLVEENLQIINEAISETRAALEKDPANAGLGRVLMVMYKKKSELLRNAVRLSPAATGKETG